MYGCWKKLLIQTRSYIVIIAAKEYKHQIYYHYYNYYLLLKKGPESTHHFPCEIMLILIRQNVLKHSRRYLFSAIVMFHSQFPRLFLFSLGSGNSFKEFVLNYNQS